MHPAKYFIWYLMTSDSKQSQDNEWIRETLKELELFEKLAPDEIVDSLRAQLSPPDNYQPSSRTHQPSIQFQRKHKVREMHLMSPYCKQACDLRAHPSHKEVVEPLLLSFTPFAQVAKQVNRRCRTRYRREVIELFYHYFFNVEEVARNQWASVIRKRPGAPLYKSALSGQTDLVLWKMGEAIVIDNHRALEEAHAQCFMRLQDMRNMPTNMATVKMMQSCIEALVRVETLMSESDVRMKDVLRQLENFQQARRETQIPSIKDLGPNKDSMKPSETHQLLPAPSSEMDV